MSDAGKGKQVAGGLARAQKLAPEERSAIAKKAAAARWSDTIRQATHGAPDRPLRIGDIEIPCYVLPDDRRVVVQAGIIRAIGMSEGGSSKSVRGPRLVKFINGRSLNQYIPPYLATVIENPIRFKTTAGLTAYGFEATVLADLCDAVLSARQKKKLQPNQAHIADQCEILMRAFARVGIVALIDEATGYQDVRAKDALARILEKFIAKELQPWVRTFDEEFYMHMFNLRKLDYKKDTPKRPQYFGNLTNDIVYRRLAPGVLEELKKTIPRNANGRAKGALHRKLTPDYGHPRLREHMEKLKIIMKLSRDWHHFIDSLDKVLPRYGDTMSLALEYNVVDDTGEGF